MDLRCGRTNVTGEVGWSGGSRCGWRGWWCGEVSESESSRLGLEEVEVGGGSQEVE